MSALQNAAKDVSGLAVREMSVSTHDALDQRRVPSAVALQVFVVIEFEREQIDAEHRARNRVVAFTQIREVTHARYAAGRCFNVDAKAECWRAVVRNLDGQNADRFLNLERVAAVSSDQIQTAQLLESPEIFEAVGVVVVANEFDVVLSAELHARALEMVGVKMCENDGVKRVPRDPCSGQPRLEFLGRKSRVDQQVNGGRF